MSSNKSIYMFKYEKIDDIGTGEFGIEADTKEEAIKKAKMLNPNAEFYTAVFIDQPQKELLY